MNRNGRIALGFIAVLVLCGILIGQNTAPPAFTVRLPQELRPETVQIDVEVSGKNRFWTRLKMQEGKYEYPVPFRFGNPANVFQPDDVESLSLHIYAPGYQAINPRFDAADLASRRTYDVQLVKQQTTHLDGLLVDSSSRPIAAQVVTLRFEPGCNNPDCIVTSMVVATTTAGRDGTFQFEVPLLSDSDAIFNTRQFGTAFELGVDNGLLQSPDSPALLTIMGGVRLSPERAYPTRITVMRILRGTISGKLGPEFLKQNNLSSDFLANINKNSIRAQIAFMNRGGGYFVESGPDGKFEGVVPPGTYDISLKVEPSMEYGIASGVVVEEGKTIQLQIP